MLHYSHSHDLAAAAPIGDDCGRVVGYLTHCSYGEGSLYDASHRPESHPNIDVDSLQRYSGTHVDVDDGTGPGIPTRTSRVPGLTGPQSEDEQIHSDAKITPLNQWRF